MKREFNKKKIYIYILLNIFMLLILLLNSFLTIKGMWGYVLLTILFLFLAGCILLLFEFMRIIPKTKESVTNICIGAGLILSLTLLIYANLYYEVFLLKGKRAFNFSGKELYANDFLYYSVTTFTTTGYGDITSLGIFTNFISGSEMLVGVITNTMLLALLTSILMKRQKS